MDTKEMSNKSEDTYDVDEILNKKLETDKNYRHTYLWSHILIHSVLQILWIIGIYTVIFHAKLATGIWAFFIGFSIVQAVAIGAHRGISHKSFKMTPIMKILVFFLQTMSGQNSMLTWVRDHRLHHKFSDTDADPHNAGRGFFFSHMGWLMAKKHPLVREKQKLIDVSDLISDKMVMFQYKYFIQLYFVCAVLFPMAVPMYFWNETWWSAFLVGYCFMYVTTLHVTWSINSFAHLYGPKPYDKRMGASQSIVTSILTLGEGRHNFHHAFPWDYRHAQYEEMASISATILDLLAFLGLAYDLKSVSNNIVFGHTKRHGDEVGHKKILDKNIKMEENNSVL